MDTKEQLLEELMRLNEQRELAYKQGLDTKPWDDEIEKIQRQLENL
jgi:hypothetical protein